MTGSDGEAPARGEHGAGHAPDAAPATAAGPATTTGTTTAPAATDALMRHLLLCDSAQIPGERLPFRLAGRPVGLVLPSLLPVLLAHGARRAGDGVDLPDPDRLPPLTRSLSQAGLADWRDEPFDVREHPDGPVLGQADRGSMPVLGLVSVGAHLNGIVRRPDGTHLWIGRRSMSKRLDPGRLDHLAAGGVPAGLTPRETLLKEAAEECGLPPDLTARAREVAVIAYGCERDEGLRRDRLHCFDLDLPEDFAPRAVDGEVAGFELWPLPRVLETLRAGDAFKFNVPLVLVDLLLREGAVAGDEARRLRAALEAMTRRHS